MPHNDPEARRAYQREYRARNLDRVREWGRANRRAYLERNPELRRKHYALSRDQEREKRRAYLAKHPEYNREYYARNRDRELARGRDRRNDNPQVWLAGQRVRISELPEELRPVAIAVREARRTIKETRNG
jgi:hypothetical protein